ncbi:MAG: transketolase [Pseudomonadota bacterium]
MSLPLKYDEKLVKQCVNSIKMLSADAVEKAASGHPGMPLGCADVAFILWHYFLRFNPKDPNWKERDTFILSAGHASAMLYSLLHVYGFDVTMDDMKQFRQLHSKTPGHPEYGVTPGVETTTGPLGQGFATGVGFALAKKITGETSKVYAIVSDGDIMEGISNEAASLAGHLGLDNMIYLYDKNNVSIEGPTNLTMSENVGKRFEALGWTVLDIDGFDHTQIMGALNTATRNKGTPFLIIASTVIGKGASKKEGKHSAHGEPLGKEELQCLRNNLCWNCEPFVLPKEVYDFAKEKVTLMEKEYKTGGTASGATTSGVGSVSGAKALNDELRACVAGRPEATRSTSGRCIQIIAKHLKGFIGGSADLGPSNKTSISGTTSIEKNNFTGKNIHFGIREHAMGAIANGLALHGGFIPYAASFLIFSDYMRASIRLSALMKKQVVYIFTHDSIFVGEDGPTHQPIEQLSSLRLMPGLNVIRPSGEIETVEAWLMALEKKNGPTALILTRQNIDDPKGVDAEGMRKGAYVVRKEVGALKCVIAAAGSEVSLAVKAVEKLGASDSVRVVSVPCMELFLKQDKKYRESVIPSGVKKISIEAGSTRLWDNIVGSDALKIGIDDFGASGQPDAVAKLKGIDLDSVVSKIRNYL